MRHHADGQRARVRWKLVRLRGFHGIDGVAASAASSRSCAAGSRLRCASSLLRSEARSARGSAGGGLVESAASSSEKGHRRAPRWPGSTRPWPPSRWKASRSVALTAQRWEGRRRRLRSARARRSGSRPSSACAPGRAGGGGGIGHRAGYQLRLALAIIYRLLVRHRLATFTHRGSTRLGVVDGDGVVDGGGRPGVAARHDRVPGGGPAGARRHVPRPHGGRAPAARRRPSRGAVPRPGRFLGIGLNYADHVAESGREALGADLLQQAVDVRRRTVGSGALAARVGAARLRGRARFVISRRCRRAARPRRRGHRRLRRRRRRERTRLAAPHAHHDDGQVVRTPSRWARGSRPTRSATRTRSGSAPG